MPYTVQLPDGRIVEVDDSVTPDQAAANIRSSFPDLFAKPESPGFIGSLKQAAKERVETALPAAQVFTGLGDERKATEALLAARQPETKYAPTQLEDIQSAFESGDFLSGVGLLKDKSKELIGASLGSQAPALAAGVTASAIGTPLAGAITYGLVAGGGYLADMIARQKEEAPEKEIDRVPAVAAAGFNTLLDIGGLKYLGISKLLGLEGGKVAKETAEEVIAAARNPKAYARAVAGGTAKGIAYEMPTEVLQTAAERWQAGLAVNPLEDPNAAREYTEALAGAVLVGGPLGAVGGAGRVMQQRSRAAELESELRRAGKQKEAEQVREQQRKIEQEEAKTRGEFEQLRLFTEEEAPLPAGVAPRLPEVEAVTEPAAPTVPEGQIPMFGPRGAPTREAEEPVIRQRKEAAKEETRLTATTVNADFARALGVSPRAGFLKTVMGKELTPDNIAEIKDVLLSYPGTNTQVQANIEQVLSRPEFVEQPLITPQEVTVPEVTVPEVVAPEVVAPEAVAPEVVAPEVVAPEVMAPAAEEVIAAPEPVAPAAEEVIPELAVPVEPVAPAAEEVIAAPEPVAPEPAAEAPPTEQAVPDELDALRAEALAVARRADAEIDGEGALLRDKANDLSITPEELRAEIDGTREALGIKKPVAKAEEEEAVRAQREEGEFAGEAEAADIDVLFGDFADNLDSMLGRPGRAEVVPGPRASGADVLNSLVKLVRALIASGAKTIGDVIRGLRKRLGAKVNKLPEGMLQQAYDQARVEPTLGAEPELVTPEGRVAQELNNKMKDISNPSRRDVNDGVSKMLDGSLGPEKDVSLETKIRRQLVDREAPIIEQLRTEFDNAVYDSLKGIRGDLVTAQVQDVSNMTERVITTGGLRINSVGLVEAFENKNKDGEPVSLDRVLDIVVSKLGKKLGSAEQAIILFENATIAQRANELNRRNATLETQARAAEAKGNKTAAKKLRDQKITVHQTKEEITAGLQALKAFPELEQAYKTFREFTDGLVDFLEQTGRINKETAENWKNNVGYVPWKRVQEEVDAMDAAPRMSYRGVITINKLPTLDRAGSKKEINILQNMVGLTRWAIDTGTKNYAYSKVLDQMPGAVKITDSRKADLLRKQYPTRIINVYEKGERVPYLLESAIDADAFRIVAPVAGPVLKVFSGVASVVRGTITHIPFFAVSQLVQDGTYRAMLLSGVRNPFSLPPKVFRNFVDGLRGKGVAQELADLGIMGLYDGMPEQLSNRLKERLGVQHRNMFKRAWDGLETFSLKADLAVRAAIYEQTLQETGDQALAYHRAKEYVNFKRQGVNPTVGTLRQMVPFMNAYMQGMDVLYRTVTGKGVAAADKKTAIALFVNTGIKLAVLNLIYSALVADDEEYEGLNEYEKDRNYIIPGTGIKIPVAPEVGFLFKVIPERVFNYITKMGTEREIDSTAFVQGLKDAFVTSFGGVNITPQLVKPVVEIATNYSFFYQGPIVPGELQRADAKYQVNEGTSEIAKWAGYFGLSPILTDYFIRAYTGIAGAMVLDATDALLDPSRAEKPLYKWAGPKIFLTDQSGRGYKSEFYKFREMVDEVTNTVNLFERQGRVEDLEKYLTEEKMNLYQFKGTVARIEKELSSMRNYRKQIMADKDLTSEEKRAIIEEVQRDEAELLKAYNIREIRRAAGL